LYAHIREWVEVPVDKVRAWIKTLPVRHFEPSAVAPQYREEAERLAKEVDSPMDIIPLPSRKGASTYTPGEIAEYKGERVRVREHIGDRVQILIPSRQEEVWVEKGKLKKLELLPQTQTYEKIAYELLEDSDFWFDVYRVKDLTGLSYEEASKVMAILANKEFLAKARAFYEGFRYPSRSAQIALQNIKAIETEQFAQTSPERHLGKPKSEVEKKTGCKPEAIPEREFDDWIKNTTEAVKEGHSPHSCLIDLFKEFGLLKEFDWMWQWGYFDEWTKHPTQKGLRELFDMAVRRYEAEHSQETGLVRKKSHYYASTEEERAEPSMADKVRQLGFNPEEFWALCEKIDEAMLGENGVMWLPAGERRQELEEKVYPLLREFEQKYGFNCPISVTGVDVFQLGMRIDNALRQRREATSKTKSLTVMPTKKKKGSSSTLEYFADSSEFLTQTVDSIGYREKIDKTFQEAIARAKGLKQWQ
jgi:hypothetical protein